MSASVSTSQPMTRWQRLRSGLLSRGAIRACWCANVVLLLGTLAWILRDGKFAEGVAAFRRHIIALWDENSALTIVPPLLWPRVDWLWFVLVLAVLSAIGIVVGLIAGAGIHRGVRAWLAVMILLAGWLTLFTTWPQLMLWGQAWRVRGSITQFDKLSQELLANWPDNDGHLTGLGPFMAYPIGKPRTLMMMTTPQVPGTGFVISTIERGSEETLHFKIAGSDEGVWLVRNEGGEEPEPFYSGLEGEYIPVQFRALRPGWFLVRYIYAPIVPSAVPEISEPRR